MTALEWFTAEKITAIATVAGVLVVVFQLRTLSKQVKLQHYSDYTKRYQEIALRFPEDVNNQDFVLAGRPDYAQTMRQMRAYFDLCFEEWDLNEKALIDAQFWRVWKGGMTFAFTKPAFQQAWSIIKLDSSFGRNFEAFVDQNAQRTFDAATTR